MISSAAQRSPLLSAARKYSHAVWLLYFPAYLLIFSWLERVNTRNLRDTTIALDHQLPFCEWFIIPYLLWFAYVAWIVTYLFFRDRTEFCRTMRFLSAGMTVFLVISAVFPNMQDVRPALPENGSILTDLTRILYAVDTPTNVFPSIHVFNAIGAYLAVRRSRIGMRSAAVRTGCLLLTVLIICSTVFLKQHSLLDVIGALGFAGLFWRCIYRN